MVKRDKKLLKLRKILQKLKRVVIAFSGGLDSTFLLKVARDTLGTENVLAVIAKSTTYPEREYANAVKLARKIGSDHITVYTKETRNRAFLKNPVNRCYYCKRELFSLLKKIAAEKDFNNILDGFNHDDKKDLRFGSIAGRELGVRSPLAEAGIGKKEIRVISKRLGLSTWDKPSLACLASRIPYGDSITGKKLKKINQAEEMLEQYGFKQVRVRLHGDIARIEVLAENIKKFSDIKMRHAITNAFKKLGFSYIALDLEGYRTGSMNEVIRHTGEIMKHKRITLVMLISLLLASQFFNTAVADIVHLKNGGLISGTVAEQTESAVTVIIPGGKVTLEKKDIQYVEKSKDNLEDADIKKLQEESVSSNTAEEQIRNMFTEYVETLKSGNANKNRSLISSQSIRAGEGNVQPFQMQNQYNMLSNNPYDIRMSGNRKEALLTFKDSRNGTACPFIVVNEGGGWKVDFTQMWQRIRFGPGDKWYWINEWNK